MQVNLVSRYLLVYSCLGFVPLAVAQEAEKLTAEVTVARAALQEHPKFKKYYEHLSANPDTLAVNGPKLAVLLAAEAKTSAAIKDHAPSLLATWQEVVRLAAAGNDYKTAFRAIDSLQQHPSGLLTPAKARVAKGKILAAVAEANAAKPVPGEREALLELVRGLLKDTLAANDVEALPSLLAADAKLSWSTAESANSVQLLLPFAQQALDGNHSDVAKLLFDHLDGLVLKTAAGKTRKDFTDALAAARGRLKLVEGAQQAQLTLATKPLDPAANQTYGEYLLASGQARESLTYLALGNDPEWKKLAAESIEAKTAAEKVALADRWVATNKDAAAAKGMARLLYEEGLADKAFVGIPRAAAEEKLKGLGPAPANAKPAIATSGNKPLPANEWVDVLPLIDIDQDVGRGFWTKGPQNSLLVAKSPVPAFHLPVILKDCSYDLVVEFKLVEGKSDVYLILPVGDRATWLAVDSNQMDLCRFTSIANGPTVQRNLLHPSQSYRFEVNVRLSGDQPSKDQAQLTFSLNGDKIIEHQGPVSGIESPKHDSVDSLAQPTLHTYYRDSVAFTRVRVRAIDGPATIGRDLPLAKPIPPNIVALKPTPLTTLKALDAKAWYNYLGVSGFPAGWTGETQPPLVGGEPCRDFLFAHASSSLSYAIPPKAKYFTAVANGAYSGTVKFIVKVDGKELFSTEKAIAPLVVEIPEGGKVLELECDPLGNPHQDHSFWCYPAFR